MDKPSLPPSERDRDENMPLQPMSPGVAPQSMSPGVAPQSMSPGVAPQSMSPGVAPQSMSPGVAPQPMSPGVAPQPMSPGVAPQSMSPKPVNLETLYLAPQLTSPKPVNLETLYLAPQLTSPEPVSINQTCPTCNVQFQPFDKNLANCNRVAYHRKCFSCSQCKKVLGETKEAWVFHEEKVYCKPCHMKEVVNKCVKCKGSVTEASQSITQAGPWCPKCFACQNCRRKLKKDQKYSEIVGGAQLFCEHCQASYQKAKYAFEMNRPGT